MSETTVVSEKFTVTYKRKRMVGAIPHDAFLGSDSHSGGYPYFSDRPDSMYLRDNLADAINDATMVENTMTTYHGNDEVDFDTIRVVRYKAVIETIDDIAAAHHDALIKSATAKLSAEELAALIYSQHAKG